MCFSTITISATDFTNPDNLANDLFILNPDNKQIVSLTDDAIRPEIPHVL